VTLLLPFHYVLLASLVAAVLLVGLLERSAGE
jgi:hypothetical protein